MDVFRTEDMLFACHLQTWAVYGFYEKFAFKFQNIRISAVGGYAVGIIVYVCHHIVCFELGKFAGKTSWPWFLYILRGTTVSR